MKKPQYDIPPTKDRFRIVAPKNMIIIAQYDKLFNNDTHIFY